MLGAGAAECGWATSWQYEEAATEEGRKGMGTPVTTTSTGSGPSMGTSTGTMKVRGRGEAHHGQRCSEGRAASYVVAPQGRGVVEGQGQVDRGAEPGAAMCAARSSCS